MNEGVAVNTILLQRIRDLEERNKSLRLEAYRAKTSRDRWCAKCVAKTMRIQVLTSAVRQARASRDMWRHRYMRDIRGDA